MPTLADLAERQKALEEEVARATRQLDILRQIEALAAQLDEAPAAETPPGHAGPAEPEQPALLTVPPGAKSERAPAAERPIDNRQRKPATPKALPQLTRPGGPAATKAVLDALADGPVLQKDLTAATKLNSGTVWRACKELERAGKIIEVGKGGYLDRSPLWKRTDQARPTTAPPDPKAAASKRPTQEPSLEGRILSALQLQAATPGELAQRTGIPMSTITNRILPKLTVEGEVVGIGKGRWRKKGA